MGGWESSKLSKVDTGQLNQKYPHTSGKRGGRKRSRSFSVVKSDDFWEGGIRSMRAPLRIRDERKPFACLIKRPHGEGGWEIECVSRAISYDARRMFDV